MECRNKVCEPPKTEKIIVGITSTLKPKEIKYLGLDGLCEIQVINWSVNSDKALIRMSYCDGTSVEAVGDQIVIIYKEYPSIRHYRWEQSRKEDQSNNEIR